MYRAAPRREKVELRLKERKGTPNGAHREENVYCKVIPGAESPMKDTDENSHLSTDTAYSERQVMLYPTTWEDSNPGTMEDIKISIVNDRATGLKRQREETTADTPCPKKLCSVVFRCSTPSSTSLPSCSFPSTSKSKAVKQSHVSTPSHTLEQNPKITDEWDDSLLEPLDNEDDSPLYLTMDEMDSLLEDDCYAAEPSEFDICNAACSVTSESEDEKEKLCTSPSQLDVSNSLTKATLCEEDLNNYAAMAPSPSHSVIHSLKVQASKHKSIIVGNVKCTDSVQEANGISTFAVPVLDKTEALTHQPADDCSSNLPTQSPNSLYTMDDVLEWNDDPELPFDGDIDDLLAISSGGESSSEEEKAAESIQCTNQIRSAVSDSTSTSKPSNSVSVNEIASSATADVVQQLSPPTSDALKIHCPPSTLPEPPKDSGSPSVPTVVISETKSNIESAKDVKPCTSTDSDAQSTVGLSNQPVDSSAVQTSSSHQTTTASVKNSSAAAAQIKSFVAVPPLPRPAQRCHKKQPKEKLSLLSDLESNKDNYCDQVLMHIEDPAGANNAGDPLHELTSLLKQISKENQNWQHPSNFSRRNHPRSGMKPSSRCSLKEWVEKNGGAVQRFKDTPSSFQRSPIPDVLPVKFS